MAHEDMARQGGKSNSLKQPKEEVNIKYMHRPPLITPNYGNQRRSVLPKSKVSRVLLYDNATQDHMLDIKLAHINIERDRICRIINLHKRSFSHRQLRKQHLKQHLVKSAGAKQIRNNNRSGISARMQRVPSISAGINNLNLDSPVESGLGSANKKGHIAVNGALNQDNKQGDLLLPEFNNADVSSDNLKLPDITDNDKRHVIFKVKDTQGKTKVYHTIDNDGILCDLLPMHSMYPKLTDDPRFRSLQDLLVPTYYGADSENVSAPNM